MDSWKYLSFGSPALPLWSRDSRVRTDSKSASRFRMGAPVTLEQTIIKESRKKQVRISILTMLPPPSRLPLHEVQSWLMVYFAWRVDKRSAKRAGRTYKRARLEGSTEKSEDGVWEARSDKVLSLNRSRAQAGVSKGDTKDASSAKTGRQWRVEIFNGARSGWWRRFGKARKAYQARGLWAGLVRDWAGIDRDGCASCLRIACYSPPRHAVRGARARGAKRKVNGLQQVARVQFHCRRQILYI